MIDSITLDAQTRLQTRLLGLTLLTVLILPSCVTTTSGGFNTDVSEQQAIEDYMQLAIAYYDAGDMTRARANIDTVLELDSNNSDIYGVLALVNQREGDMDLADDSFNRSLRLNRENSRVRNNYAAFLFSQERFEDAYDQLQIVSADTGYEGRPVAFENLGRSALQIDRIDDAETAFERALQLNSNLFVSALELAEIKLHKQQLILARALYSQFLTNREFNGVPHTPRSLWVGIQIESQFQDSEILDGFVRLLTTLYTDSPEYQQYRNFSNVN